MPTGRPDWYDQVVLVGSDITVPISIQGSTVVLDVNIASSVTLNINITGSSVTLDVNVTNSELDVNVTNTTLNVNITNAVLDVNITNSSLDVNITNTSLDVNVTNSVLTVSVSGTADVNIAQASVYLNVKYEKNTGIYRNVQSQDINNVDIDLDLGDGEWGYFFHNMRGFVDNFGVYIKNTTGADQQFTIKITIAPGFPILHSNTFTISATQTSYAWYGLAWIRRFWPYNTMYVRFSGPAGVYIAGVSNKWGYGGFMNENTPRSEIPIISVRMIAVSEGDLPVSGTVNTINIPNTTTKVEYSGSTSSNTWVELISKEFSGKIKKLVFKAIDYTKLAGSKVRLTIDDNVIFEDEFVNLASMGLAKIRYATKKAFLVEFYNEFPVNKSVKIECYLTWWATDLPNISAIMYYASLR